MLANGSDGKSRDMASSRHSIFNVLDLVLNVTVSMLVLVSCPETKKLQDSVCYSYIQYITRSNLRSHYWMQQANFDSHVVFSICEAQLAY